MIYPKAFIDRSRRNWSVKKDLFSGLTGLEIVTPSNWLADLVKQSFLKDYIISVIHNGIDTSQFYPMKSDFRKRYGLENKIIVLSVASVWNDLKGYSDIMAIASVLGEAYRFVLVGGRDQAPKVSVPNNIIFINRTQSIREMAELYSAADVYLNLTYCDTYPTVNLEAGACGTPIISYEVGGSTESTLTFGGIVVHRGDKESVVNALKKGINKVSIDNMNTLDKKWAVSQYMKKYEGT